MSEKASDRIFSALQARIIQGEFGLNGVLTELNVAADYGVSRGTAREVLQRLCQEKYLISHPRKGYFIYNLSQKDLVDITEVRFALEKISLRLIIENCSDEQILSLRKYSAETDTRLHPDKSVSAQFHLAMAEISGNMFLHDALVNIVNTAIRIAFSGPEREINHQAIVDALLARDLDEATRLLQLDILDPTVFADMNAVK